MRSGGRGLQAARTFVMRGMALSAIAATASSGFAMWGVVPAGSSQTANGFEGTPPEAATIGYAIPVVVVEQGATLTLANADFVPHTVTSQQICGDFSWCSTNPSDPKYNNPVFSGSAHPLTTASIGGVPNLPPGQYAFYCSIHPRMKGTLIVEAPPA